MPVLVVGWCRSGCPQAEGGVVFDERSTLGLIKIRSKRASYEVAGILEEVVATSAAIAASNDSFFSEISDEDIDNLFN